MFNRLIIITFLIVLFIATVAAQRFNSFMDVAVKNVQNTKSQDLK